MKKTLWLLELGPGTIKLFYAADEIEAQEQAAILERETNARLRDLRVMPHGFRIRDTALPGTVEMPEE